MGAWPATGDEIQWRSLAQYLVRHERLTAGFIRAVHITMLALCALQGYAVKVGMMVGRGELLLFMDADGATRVSDIEKLEAALAAVSESGRLCNLYWRKKML